MKLLPEDVIRKVSYEIANTDLVQPEERDQVLQEFVETSSARQYVLDGGIDYAKDLLNQALGPQRAKDVIDILTQIQLRERPLNIVRKADTQQLTNLLLNEPPQLHFRYKAPLGNFGSLSNRVDEEIWKA